MTASAKICSVWKQITFSENSLIMWCLMQCLVCKVTFTVVLPYEVHVSWQDCTLTVSQFNWDEEYVQNWSGAVSIETNLRAGRPGFSSRQGQSWNFFFSTASRPALRPTQPPIQRVLGTLTPGVKRSGRDVNYSHPSSAEVKNAWSCTSSPQYVFMALCVVKHSDISALSLPRNVFIINL